MPYKDPEARKKYMKEYYEKNSETVKATSKKTRLRGLEENPNFYKEKHLRYKGDQYYSRYGITQEDYDTLYNSQHGCCGICGVHQSKLKKTLHVDHCHDSLEIRGLLCQKCNAGIGMLGDTVESVSKALTYLRSGRFG